MLVICQQNDDDDEDNDDDDGDDNANVVVHHYKHHHLHLRLSSPMCFTSTWPCFSPSRYIQYMLLDLTAGLGSAVIFNQTMPLQFTQ